MLTVNMSQEMLKEMFFSMTVGGIPTSFMILTSLLAQYFSSFTNDFFESIIQNFCAGLILGAVAKELFPQISIDANSNAANETLIGSTLGFVVAFIFISYLDYFIAYLEKRSLTGLCSFYRVESRSDLTGETELKEEMIISRSGSSLDIKPPRDVEESSDKSSNSEDRESQILLLASEAVSSSAQREKIHRRFSEFVDCIDGLVEDSNAFIALLPTELNVCSRTATSKSTYGSMSAMRTFSIELEAEKIDQDIHKIQYILDNCKRLLQGSESNVLSALPRIWVTEEGRRSLQRGVKNLKEYATRIKRVLHYISSNVLTKEVILEIYQNIDQMEREIVVLHDTVEGYSFKWRRRSKPNAFPLPKLGSTIPVSLIVPVMVDSMVDGFLMGATVAASHRAGLILALATCVEMGFLGIAVATRIQRCTASSPLARYSALIGPPLLMLASCVLGSAMGEQFKQHPVLYFAFISFGIVMLLYLVVNELLVEAREALSRIGDDANSLVVEAESESYHNSSASNGETSTINPSPSSSNSITTATSTPPSLSWWAAMAFFVGVYTVIVLDAVMR
mmetsp:Transcript_34344/g.49925  ORF Transcript_34344/g.49925 Transcript_34344/m.49925 type:complete len:565 (-) Transcript_34344:80-1774(-)